MMDQKSLSKLPTTTITTKNTTTSASASTESSTCSHNFNDNTSPQKLTTKLINNLAGRKAAKSLRLFRGSIAEPNDSDNIPFKDGTEAKFKLTNPCTLKNIDQESSSISDVSSLRKLSNEKKIQDHNLNPKISAELYLSPQSSNNKIKSSSNLPIDISKLSTDNTPIAKQKLQSHSKSTETKQLTDSLPLLEPVSSAIYFPHEPANISSTAIPEHLTAEAEFDHPENEEILSGIDSNDNISIIKDVVAPKKSSFNSIAENNKSIENLNKIEIPYDNNNNN
ncbi:hypothetical protein C6P40_003936, partial [Pichia californica]